MSTRILLAEDHAMVREGLRSVVEEEPGLEVAGEADNGREAVRLTRELSPGVVVMDIGMPDLNGVDATRQILARSGEIKVIALSVHTDKRMVAGMLEAGASGYVPKISAARELITAIRTVEGGGVYLSPKVQAVVIQGFLGNLEEGQVEISEDLTAREREVLQLIAEGRTSKEIASELNRSIKTIQSHRQNIMDKLNLHNVASLTKYAIRAGLTPLDG